MILDRNENKEVAVLLGAGSMGMAVLRRMAEKSLPRKIHSLAKFSDLSESAASGLYDRSAPVRNPEEQAPVYVPADRGTLIPGPCCPLAACQLGLRADVPACGNAPRQYAPKGSGKKAVLITMCAVSLYGVFAFFKRQIPSEAAVCFLRLQRAACVLPGGLYQHYDPVRHARIWSHAAAGGQALRLPLRCGRTVRFSS